MGVLALTLLFQNCGEVPQYPVGQPSVPPPQNNGPGENDGSGIPEPPPTASGVMVSGFVTNFTINNLTPVNFALNVGESITIRFRPNWNKLISMGLIPNFSGNDPAPTAYFTLLFRDPGKTVALSLGNGAWPQALDLPETTLGDSSVVGELVDVKTAVAVPATGARVDFKLSPPRGPQTLRLILSTSLLDFTGVDFSTMDIDTATSLILSNAANYTGGDDFYYDVVDFDFTL